MSMSEFQRVPDEQNIFENNEFGKIVLRYKSDWWTRYGNNSNNTLSFAELKELLESTNKCYWQKQNDFEGTNPNTGNQYKTINHKLVIPINDGKAVHVIVGIFKKRVSEFKSEHSYRIHKLKEISFIRPPSNNAIMSRMSFVLLEYDDEGDTSHNSNFESIYDNIQSLDIPALDINKDADKKIWDNYVTALRKLVKRKEQVWKINRVSEPYLNRTSSGRSESFIDIKINEDDLTEQFESDILSEIGMKEIEDWGVNKSNAFFELRNYSLLSTTTVDNLKSIGNEYFYELSDESPKHYFSGNISFLYSDENARTIIFEEIEGYLREYEIHTTINEDGLIDISEGDLQYLRKIVSDKFGDVVQIKKHSDISLKITLSNKVEISKLLREADELLKSKKGFTRQRIFQDNEDDTVIVEIGAYIEPEIFQELSLNHHNTKHSIRPNITTSLVHVDGLTIKNNFYEFITHKPQELFEVIHRINQANSVHEEYRDYQKNRTKYYFRYSNLELLKSLKLALDGDSKVFDIASSTLKLWPSNKSDYEHQIKKIKSLDFDIKIENQPFSPEYTLSFYDDLSKKRERVLNEIQNEINSNAPLHVELEMLGEFTKLLFNYEFVDQDQRDITKDIIETAQSSFKDSTLLNFENELGRTSYEFDKNEELEIKKINDIGRGVNRATFVFLDEDEKDRFEKAKEKWGDEDRFRGGISIGKLVRKRGDLFKFKMEESFEHLLNDIEEKRLKISDLQKGYIKPIFVGELANIDRMLTAIKKVVDPEGKRGSPVNANLSNFIFDSSEAREDQCDLAEIKEAILENMIETNLNDKQVEAVAKSISATDMALIQGPPGTGKTTVIAEIIWQTLIRNPDAKILITSQTNLAVDNAIERLSGKRIVRPLRIGNIGKFENEGKVFSVDRIKNWIDAEPGSKDEENNSNNAIEKWIDNIRLNCSDDVKYKKAVDRWQKRLRNKSPDIKEAFHNSYKKHINVFAATCSECGSYRFRKTYLDIFDMDSTGYAEIEFDLVIMDEASKATPPELILPLTFGKRIVILGDHKQLPPMLDEKEFGETLESVGLESLVETWTGDDYKISQFEKLFNKAPSSIVSSLDTQYRMHEQIMNCITQFYKDQEEYEDGLLCGIKEIMDIPDLSNKGSRWHGLTLEPFINPSHHAIWVNVSSPESTVNTGTSFKNEGEVEALKLVIKNLTKAVGFHEYFQSMTKDEDKEIGVISFYMPQMQELKSAIYPTLSKQQLRDFESHKFENEYGIPFRINTVDRFQGMERNILIISTVRSNVQLYEKGKTIAKRPNTNYPRALGFAKEYQRINVGLSRAKRLLIVIGNQEHFEHRAEYAEAIRKMYKIDVKQLENL
jgi:superfamily I DNA and/or RNA helicase